MVAWNEFPEELITYIWKQWNKKTKEERVLTDR